MSDRQASTGVLAVRPAGDLGPSYGAAALTAMAAVALGWAIHFANGSATPDAIMALSCGILAFAAALFIAGTRLDASSAVLTIALSCGLALQFVLLATSNPLIPGFPVPQVSRYVGTICFAGMIGTQLISGGDQCRRYFFWVLLLIFAGLALWFLYLDPNPHIDLITFHKTSIGALFRGESPYSTFFPNIYGSEASRLYPPGMVKDGMVQYGYPYPPLSLLLSAAGQTAFGDFRIGELAAVLLTAVCIAFARPSAWSFAAAILFLFTPRSLFMLDQGWIEPYVLMLLAASAWCWYRARKFAPMVLGLFFASKQYLVIATPLLLLLMSKPLLSRTNVLFLVKITVPAAILTLPLILLDSRGFFHSAISWHLSGQVRPDSLSYLTWFFAGNSTVPGGTWTLPLCVATGCLWSVTPGFRNFLFSLVAVIIPVFAMNRQAFANYYYFIIGALCLLVAVLAGESQTKPEASHSAASAAT